MKKPIANVDDGNTVGEVLPNIRQRLGQLQAQTREVTFQIGRMEVRKAELLTAIDQMNVEAKALVNSEAKRLGIPDGAPWQITGEGKVKLMPQEKVPPPPPTS